MPWQLLERANFHFKLIVEFHLRHVIFDDVAEVTSFLHQWRWACHLEDKRKCEYSLSPARQNELELKDSSSLPLGNCNKGTETYFVTQARETLKLANQNALLSVQYFLSTGPGQVPTAMFQSLSHVINHSLIWNKIATRTTLFGSTAPCC